MDWARLTASQTLRTLFLKAAVHTQTAQEGFDIELRLQ